MVKVVQLKFIYLRFLLSLQSELNAELLYAFIWTGAKSLECANVVCGHDAGCLAVPGVGSGYICVCDYHGDVKEALDKPCRKFEGIHQSITLNTLFHSLFKIGKVTLT